MEHFYLITVVTVLEWIYLLLRPGELQISLPVTFISLYFINNYDSQWPKTWVVALTSQLYIYFFFIIYTGIRYKAHTEFRVIIGPTLVCWQWWIRGASVRRRTRVKDGMPAFTHHAQSATNFLHTEHCVCVCFRRSSLTKKGKLTNLFKLRLRVLTFPPGEHLLVVVRNGGRLWRSTVKPAGQEVRMDGGTLTWPPRIWNPSPCPPNSQWGLLSDPNHRLTL